MCSVLLPPGINPVAVNKYINTNISMYHPYGVYGPSILTPTIYTSRSSVPGAKEPALFQPCFTVYGVYGPSILTPTIYTSRSSVPGAKEPALFQPCFTVYTEPLVRITCINKASKALTGAHKNK